MTGEKLLMAMQAVDPALAEDAHSPARRRMPRRLTAALIAAALVLALGAGAAAYYSDFFLEFFAGRKGGELTEEQQDAVRSLTAAVGQSQTVDGWTVTVDEAVAARNDVYIKLTVAAPEGTALDEDQSYCFRQTGLSGGPEDVAMAGGRQGVEPDGDSRDGRVTILWTYNVRTPAGSQASFADGAVRTLTLTDFCLYGDDGAYTTLAEGTWRFELTLTEQAAEQTDEAELVDGPVSCTAVSERWNSAGEIKRTEVPVTLTSFRLTALGAACEYEWSEQEALEFPDVSVTLLDGTQVRANMLSGVTGMCTFELDVPIDLARVDHVTVQGVELPMP